MAVALESKSARITWRPMKPPAPVTAIRAPARLATGADAPTTLAQAIFPVWTETLEFQPLLALLGQHRLQVAGFDPQFSGSNPDDLADDLVRVWGDKELPPHE